MVDVALSWSTNDNNSTGGQDVERSADGGASWTTVASGLGPNETSYTDTTVANGTTYEYRIERTTDHATTTSAVESVYVPKRLTRDAVVTADAATATTRTMTKTRVSAVSADTSVSATQSGKRMPRSASVRADASITASRGGMTKTRSPAVTGDVAVRARAEFNEVFPDEQTENLSWDFSFAEPFGFVSEWFEESQDLPIEVDAFTVVIDSRIVQTYELGVEYDVDGDGEAEYRTDTQTVERDGQTLTFPNLGDAGQYRLYIQQMRLGDYLRAVTVGPTRY